jgi:hypothetical protein
LNDLDIRAMASATYNEAYEAVESQENPAWAVELAATSLNLWRRVGNEQNLSIGCWLYSRALSKAGAHEAAIAVANNMLSHLAAIDEPADWLVASAHEGWARALGGAMDERFAVALEQAKASIAAIQAEAHRQLIQSQIADLL